MMYIATATRKPHLFLSHSSKDKTFVRQLANDLGVCEVDVWLDEWEITPGDSIYKEITNGIQSSRYVALIISESFLKSKWASEEVDSAFSRQMEEKNKIILPLVIEKVAMPALLKGKLYLSFMENYYEALARLSGMIHGIEPKTISNAIIDINPSSIKEVLECLRYCGVEPYMIISKDIFDELAKTGLTDVSDNRLVVNNIDELLLLPLTAGARRFVLKLNDEIRRN